MEDLFSQLIPMIFALGFAYWWRKMDESSVPPFTASLFYLFTAILFILAMFWSPTKTVRIFCGGLASYFVFVAAVHLITNDSKKYHREASIWVFGLTCSIMGTGVLTLAMDYSNTKSVLNLFIIGFVTGSLGAVLESRRAKWRKKENL